MPGEPRYSNINEDGSPMVATHKHPKWSMPSTDLAKRALAICGRRFYRKGEKMRWVVIERAMLPLVSGKVSVYPSEWVEQMLTWASKKNEMNTVITFPNLLSGLENKDSINDFVARWQKEHKNDVIEAPVPSDKVENAEPFEWDFDK